MASKTIFFRCVLLVVSSFASLLLLTQPALAQDEGQCQIELEDVILRLIQAQRAADNGSTFEAIRLIEEAQADLDDLLTNCQGLLLPLPEQYTADDLSIGFRYPAGWVVTHPESAAYMLGSSHDVLNDVARFGMDSLPPGEQILFIYVTDLTDETLGVQSYQHVVTAFREDVGLGPLTLADPARMMEVNGHQAQRFFAQSDDLIAYIDLIDYVGDEVQIVVMIGVIAAPDSVHRAEALLDAVEGSLEVPARASLSEAGVALDGVSYQDARFIEDVNSDIDAHTAVLSPDGTTIAWYMHQKDQNSVCFYALDASVTWCSDTFSTSRRPLYLRLQWSPDSLHIAVFTQSPTFENADIYLYHVARDQFTNLTDDGIEGWSILLADDFDDMPGPLWLDPTLTWGPDNKLYFIRIELARPADPLQAASVSLYRFAPSAGESELIRDLTPYFSARSVMPALGALGGELAVSPDAAQIALVAHPPNPQTGMSGVWVMDLHSQEAPRRLASADLSWADDGPTGEPLHALPLGVTWDAAGTGVYVLGDTMVPSGSPRAVIYHVNAATEAKTMLALPHEFTLADEELRYHSPRAVMIPDFSGVILLNETDDIAQLSAIYPAENGSVRVPLLRLEAFDPFGPAPASIGRNGMLLMDGYLFAPVE